MSATTDHIDHPHLVRLLPRAGRKYERFDGDDMVQDGYDWMVVSSRLGWRPLAAWGRDGWDLGEWPLVVVMTTSRLLDGAPLYGVAVYVEGDVEVRAYTSREDRDAAIDQIAEFYWRLGGVRDDEVPPVGPLPAHRCGPFSWKRLDARDESTPPAAASA